VQVQQGVVEALGAQLIGPPEDRNSAVAAKLRLVGAELILSVRDLPPISFSPTHRQATCKCQGMVYQQDDVS
jgi:hypothetical protein